MASRAVIALLVATLLLPLNAQATGEPLTKGELAEIARKKIDDFVYEGPVFLVHKKAADIPKIGKLIKVKKIREHAPNDPPGVTFFKTEFRFKGLSTAGQIRNGEFIPFWVTVTDPSWPIAHGLVVGSTADRICSVLGQPERKPLKAVERFSGETENVTFHIKSGKITKIEFDFYCD